MEDPTSWLEDQEVEEYEKGRQEWEKDRAVSSGQPSLPLTEEALEEYMLSQTHTT
ncbi:hypothetical protein DACRYDRAFT_25500 [Dacryopinax primogenitus]|uniref:Uncharacterized protein n=1 Tax=Dacryopinax primogenitus (strain DJM 731) TaxID=1858805 RepID=M5FP59_DACPD|nr:uncharacterized protein DACRYDRAFT_25500 [Dacryopinax primogenitus]EJT96833.1 hypothetical protein DACRYDRAFT_25500 [Dacryopinax primogenitus]